MSFPSDLPGLSQSGQGNTIAPASSATGGTVGPSQATSGVTIGAYNPGTAASKNVLYIGLAVVALAIAYFYFRSKK